MQEKVDRKGKYDEKRPGGRRSHYWLLSRKIAKVGEQITVGKLTDLQIHMMISRQ